MDESEGEGMGGSGSCLALGAVIYGVVFRLVEDEDGLF